jgi:N-formylglutamate amidohydrolase
MNRALKEGAETEKGEQVWLEYHHHVENCIQQVLKQFDHGIIIDIHGKESGCIL